MPIHDWTRVGAGIFHDFQNVWISQLRNVLNESVLPEGNYALSEQHAGKYIADVLTLHTSPPPELSRPPAGGVSVVEAPPKVRHKLSLSSAARSRRKTLTIRHSSGHRIIALVEIISPANKDRREHVDEFLDKMEDALHHNVHVLLVDLFPPSRHDPNGMHGAVWQRLGDEADKVPSDETLTLASYVADEIAKAYVEHLAVGDELSDMPLFLDPDYYVSIPLEKTYQSTWQGTPTPWRAVLEGNDH